MPLPILAWAVFAAASRSPVFNPPLDRPYRVVIHQERAQSGVTRRYELERRLIFHRNGAALVAEMTLVRVWQDSGGDAGRRFEMAAGALKDRIVRFRLAADGAVTSVDDEAALWAATLAGVAATASAAGGDDPMAALKHDPTSALAALPADRRKALLAAPLAGLIVSADEPLVPGSGPVSLASGIVAGPPLAGTRMVTADADGCVHVVVHAATGGDAPVSLDRERTINPASGLVLDQRETQIIGAGNDARIVREQVTIDPPVS